MSGSASATALRQAKDRPRGKPASRGTSRAARVCFPFSGDLVGGSHLSALGLIRQLDRSRFEPLVVLQYPGGKLARLFADHGIETTCPFSWLDVPSGEKVRLIGLRAAASQIGPKIAFLRKNRIDIVHTNDGRTHAAWAVAAKMAGAKLLWHHRGNPDALGLRILAPFLADRVLAVSKFSLPRPGLLSAARKAQVVHSPFDTDLRVDRDRTRALLIEELGVSFDTLLVGYFGSFIARKRPLLFIDAIEHMRTITNRPVIGVMFGAAEEPGMDLRMRARIASCGLADAVRLMGWRTPGVDWIAACDILMVPAIEEPFGRTLIEAMLVRTPIVATRSGGNIEALRDGQLGMLVEPENATALGEAALRLAAEGGSLAERAQADARIRFGVEKHCQTVTEVYENLLTADRRSHVD